MGWQLETLAMRNFKLFSNAKIDVAEKNLVILAGPNGYGKTSTFDALEYLFTGNVERIAKSGVSRTNTAFADDCLIKKPSNKQTTCVEGAFKNEEGNELKVTRMLMGASGAANNPSKIKDRTRTTIILNSETVCDDESVDLANEILAQYVGENVLEYYNTFYYVAQENRLRFLLKNESDRAQEIERLLGLEEEEETLKKIERARKQFETIKKAYNTSISEKEGLIKTIKEESATQENIQKVAYKKLMDEELPCPVWDEETPQIESKNKLSELAQTVQAVGFFSRDVELYRKDMMNKWIDSVISDRKRLKRFLYLNAHSENLEKLDNDMSKYHKILELLSKAKVENGGYDYEKYDYKSLAQLLEINVDIEEIEEIQANIEKYRNNVEGEDIARNNIVKLQQQLKEEWEKGIEQNNIGIDEKKCPLCGQPYGDKQQVLDKLEAYRLVIDSAKGDSQKLMDDSISSLKKIYDRNYKGKVNDYIESKEFFSNEICCEVYEKGEVGKREYRKFVEECRTYNVPTNHLISDEEIDRAEEIIDSFIAEVLNKKMVIPDRYYEDKKKYKYGEVLSGEYGEQLEKVQAISEQDINEKIQYISQIYYGGQMDKLKTLESDRNSLIKKRDQAKKIEEDLKEMKGIADKKISEYKVRLVKQLQVPFYLYTGRILQNYPGGLGIKMNVTENEKIRFEAERREEHDALYTLSSGQLSATAIAIALTLNKVYSQEAVKCMFIDDPVQTMDELNISSFAEVLRNDFAEYQFIISTHEDDFADYIGYKYDKYGLENCSLDVRRIEKEIGSVI